MKILRIAITLAIVAFWLAMNGLLLRRELEYHDLDLYRRGVVNFLGQDLYRERWMGIYRDHRKIGYSGFTLSKTFGDEGIEHLMTIDSLITFNLFGRGKAIRIKGDVHLDHAMVPERLSIALRVDDAVIDIEGRRDGDRLALTGRTGDAAVFRTRLPLQEMFPTDGFFPTLPVSGFEVGQVYNVPLFDPIFQSRSEASVEVLEKSKVPSNGLEVDCFVLETRFRGMRYRSWVTPDGEIVRQEVPPPFSVVLKSERRREATVGIVEPPALPARSSGGDEREGTKQKRASERDR